jgi:hypothetical protein
MGEIPLKEVGEATFSSMKSVCKIAYSHLSFTKENIEKYGQLNK